jgi:hypothetical protein
MITPGKWEYSADLGEVTSVDGDEVHHQIAIVGENDADGYLIAAAPEMLEALMLVRKFLAYTELCKVVAVIKKATGEK